MSNADISSRAKEILNNSKENSFDKHDLHLVSDKFLGSDLYFSLDAQCNILDWYIVVDAKNNDEEKLGLLCAAIDLVKKVGISHVFKVSFRETESYLRDENHLPAWEGVTANRKWFNEAISEIISGMVNALFMRQGVDLIDWDDLTYKERIDATSKTLSRIKGVFELFSGGQLELVSIEESEIIIHVGDKILSHKHFEILMERLLEYIRFALCSTKIKLVAQ
jgi:hypothetical protein